MKFLGGGVISLEILRVASIADIFVSIFFVNAMFLTLVNKIKAAALISVVTSLIVVTPGCSLLSWVSSTSYGRTCLPPLWAWLRPPLTAFGCGEISACSFSEDTSNRLNQK